MSDSENADLLSDNVTIGVGNLAGKGVYALRDFEAGELIIKYQLIALTNEQYNLLPESEQMFTHILQETIYFYSEPERYVNHSENPNTWQDLTNKCDVSHRRIVKGEMITTDSSKDDQLT